MLWTIAKREDRKFSMFDKTVFNTREDARKYLRYFKMLNNSDNNAARSLSVRKLVVKE